MSFFYTKETIEKAKKIDLLTYLQNFEPDELVRFSRDTFCTKEHDSLKIRNGKWYWFSRGFGGYNALDYLMKVKNLSFMEAMEKLVGTDDLIVTNNTNLKEQDKISRLILPEKNDNEIDINIHNPTKNLVRNNSQIQEKTSNLCNKY